MRFLHSIGRDQNEVTAADKIRWLATLVDERPALSGATIYNLGAALSEYGHDDEEERGKQATLVRAFTLELRSSRALAPPNLPPPAMPLSVFRELLDQNKPGGGYRSHEPLRARTRALLKLEWRAGLRQREVVRARRYWLTECHGGFILKCTGPTPRQNRLIPIRNAKEKALCAVVELRAWMALMPNDPQAFLFPRIDVSGTAHWDEPLDARMFRIHLKKVLRRIGAERYTFESIRRSFFRRCRDQLGEAPAFYFSGLSRPDVLYRQLRAEPQWPKLRSLFERM